MVGPEAEKYRAKAVSSLRQFHRHSGNTRLDFRTETDPSDVWQASETVSRIVKEVEMVENEEQNQT